MEALGANAPVAGLGAEPLPKDLEKACRSLEEAFVTIVFRKMHEAMVPKTSKGSSAFARETTEGMLDAQWAHLSSQGEGLGLWRTLYRQLAPAEVKSGTSKADETALEETPRQMLDSRGQALHGGQTRTLGTEEAAATAGTVPGMLGP